MNSNPDRFAKALFLWAIVLLASLGSFSYGLAIWYLKLWPYQDLNVLREHASNYVKYGVWAPKNLVVPAPDKGSRARVALHDKSAMMPGYRAILGWDFEGDRYAVFLLDANGKEVHRWTFRMSTLVSGSEAEGPGKAHAMVILDDGSIVINLEDILLARIDPCSRPVWVNTGGYHHSLESANDGSLWTLRGEGGHKSRYQFLQNLDPWTGKIIQELSLIDDFIKRAPDAMTIFRLPRDYQFKHAAAGEFMPDLFHANDVEPLRPTLADKFPEFRAGDLLISLRNINLVAVLDPQSKAIKWWMHGPWIRQHDPDFRSDGKISVFNNNVGRSRSNIVIVDPQSNEISYALTDKSAAFYTPDMGKQEQLPNGNLLITVPREGRVLEISPSGQMVFEFNNVFNERANAYVANARWLATDFFKTFPVCEK